MLALQMREIASNVRQQTHDQEKADYERRLAAWLQAQKQKAKEQIALLPQLLDRIARDGKANLLLRIEVHVFVYHNYKLFRPQLDLFREVRDGKAFRSARECAILPPAARAIARWALRQKFSVSARCLDNGESFRFYNVHHIDRETSLMLPGERQYSVHEGLLLGW